MITVTMIIGIIAIVIGLLLMVIGIIGGIVPVVIGIACVVLSRRQKKMPKGELPMAAASIPVETKIPSSAGKKYVGSETVKVVGVTFACGLDGSCNRQDILKDMRPGEPVVFEPYEYNGAPACYVVDLKTGLDIGTLPSKIVEKYAGKSFEGFLSNVDSFVPDDRDEEIYYANVKLNIME